MVFDKDWFKERQKYLLFFCNNRFTKKIFRRILRIEDDIKLSDEIIELNPNSFKFKETRKVYDFALGKWTNKTFYKADFRTHDKFAKRIFYSFKYYWYLRHFLDFVVNSFRFEVVKLPKLDFAYDTATIYPDEWRQASKFGTSCGYFNGSNQSLTAPDHADWDFGTGDFTVDTWVMFRAFTKPYPVLIGNSGFNFALLYNNTEGNLKWYDVDNYFSKAWAPTLNTWYHIAVVRSGTDLKIYIDGTQLGTTGSSSKDYQSSTTLIIGNYSHATNDYYFNGWLDEVRVSKSIARWTSNFTPPTSAYTSDTYTKLLLHMDGGYLSETFTDSGNTGHTVTNVNNTQQETDGNDTVDGTVGFTALDQTWADAIACNNYNSANNTTAETIIYTSTTSGGYRALHKYLHFYDTSTLSGATISAASIYLYLIYKRCDMSTTTAQSSLVTTSTTSASASSVTAADSQLTGTTEYARFNYASLPAVDNYFNFALNASGLTNLNTSGISKFASLVGCIFDNSQPTWGINKAVQIVFAGSDTIGTSKDTKIVITYTLTGTKFQLNIGDSWKAVTAIKINIGDSWKSVTSAKVNIGDVWKAIF